MSAARGRGGKPTGCPSANPKPMSSSQSAPASDPQGHEPLGQLRVQQLSPLATSQDHQGCHRNRWTKACSLLAQGQLGAFLNSRTLLLQETPHWSRDSPHRALETLPTCGTTEAQGQEGLAPVTSSASSDGQAQNSLQKNSPPGLPQLLGACEPRPGEGSIGKPPS